MRPRLCPARVLSCGKEEEGATTEREKEREMGSYDTSTALHSRAEREREREKERNFSAAWILPSFVRSSLSEAGEEGGKEGGREERGREGVCDATHHGGMDGWTDGEERRNAAWVCLISTSESEMRERQREREP